MKTHIQLMRYQVDILTVSPLELRPRKHASTPHRKADIKIIKLKIAALDIENHIMLILLNDETNMLICLN